MFSKSILALAVSLVFCFQLLASPSDLELTFGSSGKSLIPVGKVSFDQGAAAALQPDGKIIVVGDSISDGELSTEPRNLFIARLNSDGTRDASFGINGLTVLRLRSRATGTAVVIQPDGKVVVGGIILGEAGFPVTSLRTFLLARLLPNGVLDTSFGTDGVIKNLVDPTINTMLSGLALQADGKIVAAGYSGSAASPVSVIVTRYNVNGTPDNSFDGDGKLFVNVNPSGNRANAVSIQPDGKIVVGGSLRETTGTITDFLLMRLNTDGSFDNGFDGDGKLTTKIANTTSNVTALALQSDGKIIAVGNTVVGVSRDIALTRYNSNGSPDSSFDGDGIVVTNVTEEIANSVAIQPDGKILLGGLATTTPTFAPMHFLASRYNSDGSPDNSFDGDGRVVTEVTTVLDRATTLLLQTDERIVLAGASVDIPDADVSLARYNSNGGLDNTFDGDGTAVVELENANDQIFDLAVQADGKIVAVGYAFGGIVWQPAVARYNANGGADLSFGDQGTVILPPDADFSNSSAFAVAVQPDGKIVFAIDKIVFDSKVDPQKFTAVRLNANGSVDQSFGMGGTASFSIGTDQDLPTDLALQPDGKIIIAGNSISTGISGPSMLRLNSNGSLDDTFGAGGRVFTTDQSITGAVRSLALQSDGKIVLAGSHNPQSGDGSFFTSRYNVNGSIDATYGGTGAVYTPFGVNAGGWVVKIQTDGKIVVGGSTNGGLEPAAARYNVNGSLDNTFDGDGKLIVPAESGFFYSFNDLAIQPNGKLVFGGRRWDPANVFGTAPYKAALFRFDSNGSPDTSFAPAGRIVSMIGNHDSYFSSVDLLPNGKILAGGSSSNGLNDDFTVVRYVGDSAGTARAPFDFDGDGKTDIGIFRPVGAASEWWINRSGNGQTFALQFGAATDRIAPADYTGDGKTDIAFFRPASGEWYVLRSEDFSFFALPFGTNGDVPVPADYDADGKADFAVFRPSSSTWFISQSSGAPTRIEGFGIAGDQPVVADYDGDGKADVAVFRPAAGGGEWWINRSTAGLLAIQFGAATDKAVQGDYTGDGKADIAIWRPATGEWYIVRSEDSSFFGFPFGASGDVPAPGDYDGDGRFDPTVFRPSSATWFIARTTAGTLIVQFGANGDRPVPNAFVP